MTDKKKLEKLKKLADTMYYAAQYLTTDASRLHKAMDEYHKFIIHECKEEPVSEDLEEEIDTYLATYFGGEKEKQDWPFLKKMAIHFAQWQKEKDEKKFELLKEWFEDIAEKCERLTSGNVSHNGKMIRGYARNCAEYIKSDLL